MLQKHISFTKSEPPDDAHRADTRFRSKFSEFKKRFPSVLRDLYPNLHESDSIGGETNSAGSFDDSLGGNTAGATQYISTMPYDTIRSISKGLYGQYWDAMRYRNGVVFIADMIPFLTQ